LIKVQRNQDNATLSWVGVGPHSSKSRSTHFQSNWARLRSILDWSRQGWS